ncbi:protein C3orf33 homolog isoform X2 [Hippocampus zosterae]|uniref:protein C3orf33 homolog isoform X2 n=1 Tax=Hippocampus zosterae TaxID=109293 RepID=UPI00223E61E7|nr:protein C3orf33 homolog isoform X2 [Hippocampus zosterae]
MRSISIVKDKLDYHAVKTAGLFRCPCHAPQPGRTARDFTCVPYIPVATMTTTVKPPLCTRESDRTLSQIMTIHKYGGGPSTSLLVNLAGVDLTADGKLWLQRSVLPTQTVWLKLISRQDDTLHCFVTLNKQGSSWRRSVNEQALSLGLARTAPVTGLSPDTRFYWRLHKRLHRAEVKAEKKRLGLWKEESQWKRVVKTLRDNALFRLIRRIFRKT